MLKNFIFKKHILTNFKRYFVPNIKKFNNIIEKTEKMDLENNEIQKYYSKVEEIFDLPYVEPAEHSMTYALFQFCEVN